MSMKYSLTTLCTTLLIAATAIAAPTVDETIAQARAHIGSENAIKSVSTIHYTGTYEGAGEDNSGTLEIFLKAPNKQYLETRTPSLIEITANNDIEGYRKRINPEAPDEWAVNVLGYQELKTILVNSRENLNFFDRPSNPLATVEDLGLGEMDGKQAHILKYKYTRDIWYTRYFEIGTGRLLATENSRGLLVKEEGEIEVSGLKFPKQITTFLNGEQSSVVVFDKVEINIEIPDSRFELPSLSE